MVPFLSIERMASSIPWTLLSNIGPAWSCILWRDNPVPPVIITKFIFFSQTAIQYFANLFQFHLNYSIIRNIKT